jgi:hypothetical protein
MLVTGRFQDRHRHFEKLRIKIGITAKFTARMSHKELGVFFVSEAVSRNVFGLERDRLLERRSPLLQRLPRQAEHQIHVNI